MIGLFELAGLFQWQVDNTTKFNWRFHDMLTSVRSEYGKGNE